MGTAADVIEAKARSGERPCMVSVRETHTVLEAVQRMNDHHIGSVIVEDRDGGIAGIFTERDLLKRVVAAGRSPERTRVAEVMTRDVVTCTPDTPQSELRELMRSRRIRHVPVTDDSGHLVGLVSIGDLNAVESRRLSETVTYLEEFITRS